MTSLSSINDLLKHNDIVSLTFDKWLKCTQVLPLSILATTFLFILPHNIYLQPERP